MHILNSPAKGKESKRSSVQGSRPIEQTQAGQRACVRGFSACCPPWTLLQATCPTTHQPLIKPGFPSLGPTLGLLPKAGKQVTAEKTRARKKSQTGQWSPQTWCMSSARLVASQGLYSHQGKHPLCAHNAGMNPTKNLEGLSSCARRRAAEPHSACPAAARWKGHWVRALTNQGPPSTQWAARPGCERILWETLQLSENL